MKMMTLMMTITYFSEKKKKNKKTEEIRVPELGGQGGSKGFWPEYLLMCSGKIKMSHLI